MTKRLSSFVACLVGYVGGIWSVAESLPKGFGGPDFLWIALSSFLFAVLAFPEIVRARSEERLLLFDGLILTSLALGLTASALVYGAVGLKGHHYRDLGLLPYLAFGLTWFSTLPLVVGIAALRSFLTERRVGFLSRSLGRWDTGHLAVALVPVLVWGAILSRHALLEARYSERKAANFRSLDFVRATLDAKSRRFPVFHEEAEKSFRAMPPKDSGAALVACAASATAVLGCALVDASGSYLVAARVKDEKCDLCAHGECSLEKSEGDFEVRKAILAEHHLPNLATTVPRFLPTSVFGRDCEEISRLVPLEDERGFLLISISLRELSRDFVSNIEKAKITRGRAFLTDSNGTIVASSDGSHLTTFGQRIAACRTSAECGILAESARMNALGMLRRGRAHSSMALMPPSIWLISAVDLNAPHRPPWLLTVLSEFEVPP